MNTQNDNEKKTSQGPEGSQSEQASSNDGDWKNKINGLMQVCQDEFKKTTQIGMKMLSASQSNAQLHEAYESIGLWLIKAVDEGKISIDDEEVKSLMAKAKELESQLQDIENDVQDIKKG